MCGEETAFIWVQCVAWEASSDSQPPPTPFIPKHASVFDVCLRCMFCPNVDCAVEGEVSKFEYKICDTNYLEEIF